MTAMNSTDSLYESRLHSLPLLARGKVRDNYAVGDDRILMIASDRLSGLRRGDAGAHSRQGRAADAHGAVLVRANSRTSCPTI
jgi:phosphoribosylaminoimidazole-succinocarboxamide synthase